MNTHSAAQKARSYACPSNAPFIAVAAIQTIEAKLMNRKILATMFVAAAAAAPLLASAGDAPTDVPFVVKEPVDKAPPAFPMCKSIARARCSVDSKGYPPSTTCDVVKYEGLTYWPMTFDDNRYAIVAAGYDEKNKQVKTVYATGTRYIWKTTVDNNERKVTFWGQGETKAAVPWDHLAAGTGSVSPCQPNAANNTSSGDQH
jgi:hypothetical protein